MAEMGPGLRREGEKGHTRDPGHMKTAAYGFGMLPALRSA
jgi:hypothetical protein